MIPLGFSRLVELSKWSLLVAKLQLSGIEVDQLGIAKSISGAVPDFDLEMRDVIDAALVGGSTSVVLADVATLMSRHFGLFWESSLLDRLALQDHAGGPLTVYTRVESQDVDPSISCPNGHPMPGINRESTHSSYFGVSSAAEVDETATDFSKTLDQYFALTPPARRQWLDLRYRGLPSDTDGYRLQGTFHLPIRDLRLCTERCGFLHYQAKWFTAAGGWLDA